MEPAIPHSMEDRCLVAPHPEVRRKILGGFKEIKDLITKKGDIAILNTFLRPREKRPPGFNDGLLRPHSTFRPGTTLSAARASRPKPRGVNNVAVILVDFPDRKFDATQDINFYNRLWFGIGTNSVRDYYRDVSNGLVDIQGQVVGPLRMPHSMKFYSDNQNGLGDNPPNARVMARDAAKLADKVFTFTKYDNDGDGYVDAFVIVHAGQGAERTGLPTDIWSHKYVLDGGPLPADNTLVYAYLTVPADGKLGVCAHEIGHLLFGWPDLYDMDCSSAGIGSWCLMASGSYNGNGDNPAEPCAWCKVDQGWVTDTEYFLLENRQQNRRDGDLPGGGLCLWHIDESKSDNNDEKNGYKVALVQADGLKQLERDDSERGDGGDVFPGDNNVRVCNWSTNPNTNANNGAPTCVSISDISDSAHIMTFTVNVADYSAGPPSLSSRS